MKIVLLCEGDTELALKGALKPFLDTWCDERGLRRVKIDVKPFDHSLNCKEIQRHLARHGRDSEVVVIGLADVYPKFRGAAQVKEFLANCVRDSEFKDKFFPHAAQYEFEAWLLPFWDSICKRLGIKAKRPGANPEMVDDQKPPSKHLRELYAKAGRRYEKVTEAVKILKGRPIEEAAEQCPQLQELLDTLVKLCNPTAS